jgi:DNA-binding PadR family transcriptional regulator
VEEWAGASPYSVEWSLEHGGSAVLHFGKSAAYAQSKRLAEAGYLSASLVEEERPRPTMLYRLTRRGKEEVERWLGRPPTQSAPLETELILRTRAASFVDPTIVLQGLRLLRPPLSRSLANLDAREVRVTDGRAHLSEPLEIDMRRSVVRAQLAWLKRAEKALLRQIRLNAKEAELAQHVFNL